MRRGRRKKRSGSSCQLAARAEGEGDCGPGCAEVDEFGLLAPAWQPCLPTPSDAEDRELLVLISMRFFGFPLDGASSSGKGSMRKLIYLNHISSLFSMKEAFQ